MLRSFMSLVVNPVVQSEFDVGAESAVVVGLMFAAVEAFAFAVVARVDVFAEVVVIEELGVAFVEDSDRTVELRILN